MIERFALPGSVYMEDARQIAASNASDIWMTQQTAAVVQALHDDYAHGGLVAVEEIVHADLFDDFLGMAQELLDKGFIGPAAVLAGSVLEGHLHKLALRSDIELTDENGRARSVEAIGVDLRKRGVLTEVQRKSLAAWYAQRTEGAHGRSENLDPAEVGRTIDGVRDFIARFPA